jgi:hypothetical protein
MVKTLKGTSAAHIVKKVGMYDICALYMLLRDKGHDASIAMQSAAQTDFWTLQCGPQEKKFMFYDRVLEKIKTCKSVGVQIDDNSLIALLIKSATQSTDLREQARLLDIELRGNQPPDLGKVVETLEIAQKTEDVNRDIAKKSQLLQRDTNAFKARHVSKHIANFSQTHTSKEKVPLGNCRSFLANRQCKFGTECKYKHTNPSKDQNVFPVKDHQGVFNKNKNAIKKNPFENKYKNPPKQNNNRQQTFKTNQTQNKPTKRSGDCHYCGIPGHGKGECGKFARDNGKDQRSQANSAKASEAKEGGLLK